MPTKFSQQEQQIIREKLVNKATEFFSKHGFKKTSVKELTDAAGVSKGSFYSFFDSKEELLFEVFEEQEKFRNKIMSEVVNSDMEAEEAIKYLFHKALENIERNQIFQRIYEENLMERIIRKIPPQRIKKHQEQDLNDALGFIKHLQKNSNLIDEPPKVIVGLFRAAFFLTLYENEIGKDIYEDVANLLIECLAKGLTQTEEQ
ncbi:MAG: TetR/AcrR family transcriptional regulator [Candidatus Marinimicrobia bacterium]|nr:TetR/AcrR family transcriptional regulator [Candidatus Neomarinimicrobiota bacterium]